MMIVAPVSSAVDRYEKAALRTREITTGFNYYLRNTSIPVNFGLGLFMVFVVGMSVAGQTFCALLFKTSGSRGH